MFKWISSFFDKKEKKLTTVEATPAVVETTVEPKTSKVVEKKKGAKKAPVNKETAVSDKPKTRGRPKKTD
jgi:hypothetical protein